MRTNITVREVVIGNETLYGVYADDHLLPITAVRPCTSRRSQAEREAARKRQCQFRISAKPDGYHCQFRSEEQFEWCHCSTSDNRYAIFPTLAAAKQYFTKEHVAEGDVAHV